MKIAIVGYGREGRSSYTYFTTQGHHDLTICDQNEEVKVPPGVATKLGSSYIDGLDAFDLIVRSSGLEPHKILAKNPGVESKITTQLNEFLKVCPSKNIIGVTGTKGKGTTSTLIAQSLQASGEKVVLGGNIGIPPLDLLPAITPNCWVVLELSSFQLADLHESSPHIAVCLMMEGDHLNWHQDMVDYEAAKTRLFSNQGTEDIAIYFAGDETSQRIAAASPGHHLPYYAAPGAYIENETITIDGHSICKTDEIKLLGQHNWQNVCAAVTAVWQVKQDVEALRSVITSFSGLEHRLEFVREVGGVRYYNDSFASNPYASEAAIEAVPGKKVMIIGGFERMLDLERFSSFIQNHANVLRTILIIGESGRRLEQNLMKAGFTNYLLDPNLTTMSAIVTKAQSLAQPGDAVVLSPGFASFDMFENFEDRGRQFKSAVEQL